VGALRPAYTARIEPPKKAAPFPNYVGKYLALVQQKICTYMKIALIREEKVPIDKRVALTPEQCLLLKKQFPHVELVVQPSTHRCFPDSEYEAKGLPLQEDLSDCDVLIGIKEVPIPRLIPYKTYLFFSHTIKKQAYNRGLLQALLAKNIRMVDYEKLTDDQGQRVIAFGRYAGLVGAYNGLLAYGKRLGLYQLKRAVECFDLKELKQELQKVQLPPIKIVVTGGGRVAQGAMEILAAAGIEKVSAAAYRTQKAEKAVFAQLNPEDYNRPKDAARPFDLAHFFAHPEQYEGDFDPYLPITDMLIAAAYWDPKAPVLFTRKKVKKEGFNIKVVADITCDIDGSVATTRQPSTIADPFYDYHPESEQVVEAFSDAGNITVMAVDNLPSELPRDASFGFGEQLLEHVLHDLFSDLDSPLIARATICKKGALTPPFQYLQDFADGKG